ncbi:MAG TPA: VWA domain-containing protein [Abditibacteriaceae bacterium]|nr:VWA domain-containing protein [Abditibacteriaceae bacterium]
MLDIIAEAHRASLKAGTPEMQKLFVMLKLLPQAELARTRPALAFALVIDTSDSMREASGEGSGAARSAGSKIDRAMEAAHALIDDRRLAPDDRVTIIHFDAHAHALLPLSPLRDKRAAHEAIDALQRHHGTTYMAQGMRCAGQQLAGLAPFIAKRVLLLSDGETADAEVCRGLAEQFANANTPLISVGVGTDYNDALMRDVAQISQGRPYHLESINQLHEVLNTEVGSSVREVVTDLQANITTVKGVALDSVTRVYPSLSDAGRAGGIYRLGNIATGDYTVFILDVTISGITHRPSRARLAQVSLTGHVPGGAQPVAFAAHDICVNFTVDEAATATVDMEVLGYVQQKNVDRLVQAAVSEAPADATRARHTLRSALGMTQRMGNTAMTRMINKALDELDTTGALSPGTRKTVSLGVRTRTVKTSAADNLDNMPSDEVIRKLTGA